MLGIEVYSLTIQSKDCTPAEKSNDPATIKKQKGAFSYKHTNQISEQYFRSKLPTSYTVSRPAEISYLGINSNFNAYGVSATGIMTNA